jgi:hypothetical protein
VERHPDFVDWMQRQGKEGKGADDGGLGGAAGVQLLPLPEPRLPPRRHYLQGLSGEELPSSLSVLGGISDSFLTTGLVLQ